MTATPARSLVRHVVTRVRESQGWVRQILDARLAEATLDVRDASFAAHLALGTVSFLGTLDEAIDRFARDPSGVDPVVRDALQVGVYEILFMDTPRHAAVSQSVDLVREMAPHATGFANAVLRRVNENADDFPWGDADSDDAALARLTGHPRWIVDLFVREYGRGIAASMLHADTKPAPVYAAHNPFAGSFDSVFDDLAELGAEPSRAALPGSLLLGVPQPALASSVVSESRVLVCDLAAQAVTHMLPLDAGWTIADTAAGRGTKTLLLAARGVRLDPPLRITAFDLHEFKTRILRERLAAARVPGVEVCEADATDRSALASHMGGPADAVIVDAPCSGLGTLRRHPEKRWRLQPNEIEHLAGLGGALLAAAARLVRPEGFVVYSTCTVVSAENRDVIDAFLGSEVGSTSMSSTLVRGSRHRCTPG